MKCTECLEDIGDANMYLSHIQTKHGIKGKSRCVCPICATTFGDFSVFKRHYNSCLNKRMNMNEDSFNAIFGNKVNLELLNFDETLKSYALHLALKMCAKPNFPRNVAFEIVKEVSLFIHKITDVPQLKNDSSLIESFISVVESSFEPMNTEHKLMGLLGKMDLTNPLIKIDVALNERMDAVKGSDDESTVEDEEKPKCTLTIMPLRHQIKQFFELPNVFEKIMTNTAAIQAQTTLCHFIKGSVWQSKISNYGEGQIVIPYNFYVDGVQLNNQLGPHTELGLENFNYITFPTIPSEYNSRLNNIMVASLFQEKTIKEHGTKAVYCHIISELTSLANEGVVLNINDQPIVVFFVMGIFEGDNKESNRSLDFPNSHSAIHYCRFCRLDRDAMALATEENLQMRRTKENYYEDVLTNNMTLTGVKAWSVFNAVPYFHAVNGTANDLPHDLLEGVLPYSYKRTLLNLIFDRAYFTIDQLNERMKTFSYGPDDCGNIPPTISAKYLKDAKKVKVKMNAAEMFNFTQCITFLIGQFIPEGGEDGEVDPVWQFVKNLVKLFDLCYLPWYEPGDLTNLRRIVKFFLEEYQELFEELKPVFHYLTHYATNTEFYGPQRYLQTIRKEGKHKEMKMYTKNSNNRINISQSVAKKVQNTNALRVFSREGLEDIITISKTYKDSIRNKPYYRNIGASEHSISACECNFTSKVVVNGMTFKTDTWLPDFTNKDKPNVYKVGDIVIMDPGDISSIYLICKLYEKLTYEDHFVAYSVELGSVHSHLHVINVKEYLLHHQYPVFSHFLNNKLMFRCKRF